MIYNTTSNFPSSVDDRVFVSDVSASNKPIMDKHMEYIANGEYTHASDYINSQSGITPINADLCNMIVNRLIATQEYLLSLEPCVVTDYGDEPLSPIDGQIWIE